MHAYIFTNIPLHILIKLSHYYNFTLTQINTLTSADLWRTDGGSGWGVGDRGGRRWIEEFAAKGVGAFALADGDPRRSTESRKMARRKISQGVSCFALVGGAATNTQK